MIPPMALQTVVENAVRHGIEQKPEGGQVLICAVMDKEDCLITVKDTGPGFDPDSELYWLQHSSARQPETKAGDDKSEGRKPMGLYSAYYRIVNLCGGSFTISSKKGEGTVVSIRLAGRDKANSPLPEKDK